MATTSKNARSSAEPNVLHKFASYNTLFTLSALSTRELRNPKQFFESKPHDIIVQSGGIGPDANRHEGPPSEQGQRFSAQTKATLKKNKGMQDAINRSTLEFIKNNDLYFKSVELTSIPGYNEKRRLTSVAYINMELVEPSGITLIEKVKAAAANNGFIDHLDAPYMLTVEFKGFDESGSDMQIDSNFTKRVIPIKLVTMDIDVTQAGSVYKIKAIPYNEFALTNNFMYPRTSGTLTSSGLVTTFQDAVADLQRILNEQNKDEQTKGLNVYPDQYNISISEDLNPRAELSYEVLHQAGMTQRKEISAPGESALPDAFTMDYIRFSTGVHLPKLLEDLMKTHPDFEAKNFDEWAGKIQGADSGTIGDPNSGLATHFKYFRIRTGVVPTKDFDPVRQTNAKIINIVVEPHYINAYNLAVAGVHQDNKYKQYVAKEYNYIFTGDNVDILDLDINYKVAYFQSRLKSLEGTTGFNVNKNSETEDIGSPTNTDNKGLLPTKSEAGIHQNASSRTGQADARVDQFFDAITHPLADMVVINMNILGDPAWLGVSQFIPATPEGNNGSSTDNNITFFHGGEKNMIWNPKHRCYNYDVADAVVNLVFKTPQDFNDKTGVYQISDDQRQVFSGLYKVVQVQHNFTDGQFTQNLTMVRYNNQDNKVTVTKNQQQTIKDGVVTGLVNQFEQRRQDIISGEIGSS